MFADKDAGQVVAFSRVEQRFVRQRAWRDDLSDLAFDQTLCRFGIFDLIADRRAVSGSDQFVEIIFQGVVRKAGHRGRVGRILVATGQRQAEDFRRDLGVFVEEFVEVAHPKQQERAGILALDLHVPFHHRCQFCGVLRTGHRGASFRSRVIIGAGLQNSSRHQ